MRTSYREVTFQVSYRVRSCAPKTGELPAKGCHEHMLLLIRTKHLVVFYLCPKINMLHYNYQVVRLNDLTDNTWFFFFWNLSLGFILEIFLQFFCISIWNRFNFVKINMRIWNAHENRNKTVTMDSTYELFFPQVSSLERHLQEALVLGMSGLGHHHRWLEMWRGTNQPNRCTSFLEYLSNNKRKTYVTIYNDCKQRGTRAVRNDKLIAYYWKRLTW